MALYNDLNHFLILLWAVDDISVGIVNVAITILWTVTVNVFVYPFLIKSE